MIRLLLIGYMILVGCLTANAVPAKPGVKRTVTLADGQKVETTLHGDEFFHFYADNNGFAYKQKNKKFERITLEDAYKEWTSCVMDARKLQKSKTRTLGVPPTDLTGKKKVLVILMQFADVKFTTENTQAVYNDFFNKENYTDYGMTGSVKDYFKAQSYNKFELDFDVVGPFTAPDSMACYGRDILDNSGKRIGDTNPSQLIYEGCLMADSLVNFADYDWDGDGWVEQVFVIYAGYAQSQGGPDDSIWPQKSAFRNKNLKLKLDGVHIDDYACTCELRGASGSNLDGIGTACHEFSHCLGLPDMYDTKHNEGAGTLNWDVMYSGAYNNNSRTPAGYTSFERMFAGWLTPTELKGDMVQITDMQPLVDAPEAYILYNEANKDEYYLLENRQNKGFDAKLYGHGLLVLHIDYTGLSWMSGSINNDPNHQRCTIIPADNHLGEKTADCAGDPFPGTTNNTALTNYTTPAATLYNKNTDGEKLMNKPIVGITESEYGLISFTALRPQLAPPTPSDGEAVGDENSFRISWPAVEGATGYQVELTERGFAPSNVADALEHEFMFNELVTDSEGTKDISKQLDKYGLEGWGGFSVTTSPNKMLIGVNYKGGYLITNKWNMPNSEEITLILGANKVKEDSPVNGNVIFTYYDEADKVEESTRSAFNLTDNGKLLFHFNCRRDLYYFVIDIPTGMYLNYLAVYNGTWSADDLGITAINTPAATRGAASVVYDTDTNSYTFTNLNKNCKYYYRVRACGAKEDDYSIWSAEKLFVFGSTGISSIQQPTTRSQKIYNLQGRSMGTNSKALPKGVYIINGKKVVVD